jgi:DNA-directed RNA polymerase subunit RPC12/RpoP
MSHVLLWLTRLNNAPGGLNMIKLYECTQCGSTDFNDAGIRQVRCSHCGSLFRVLTDEPKLTILKGANVVFGKNANVEIHGDVEIQDGADVDIQGKILLVKGKQKRVFGLELIRESNEKKTGSD